MNTNIEGGVCAAIGFKANGVDANIKNNGKRDMALVVSEKPCVTAGTFTTNKVKAAPVKWDYKVVHEAPYSQAIVVNTGIANAGTGAEGYGYCEEMAAEVSKVTGIPKESVIVASTGVIGKQLPMDIIKAGINALPEGLARDTEHAQIASEAIMTTDTRPKQVAVNCTIAGKTVTVGGMCKGAGMIHPNMATMLCFITTDCAIDKTLLQKALSEIVDETFNMITVDGDTSTNDSCLVLANGMAENAMIVSENDDYRTFYEALNYVMLELSKKIAGDGEGATSLFECQIKNAPTKKDAKILARAVVGSNLAKAAVYGHDANWGRILCAMGYSGADFNPDTVDISYVSEYGTITLCRNSQDVEFSEEFATKILSAEHVIAVCDCKDGEFSANAYGCDLTHEYVSINADYRS